MAVRWVKLALFGWSFKILAMRVGEHYIRANCRSHAFFENPSFSSFDRLKKWLNGPVHDIFTGDQIKELSSRGGQMKISRFSHIAFDQMI